MKRRGFLGAVYQKTIMSMQELRDYKAKYPGEPVKLYDTVNIRVPVRFIANLPEDGWGVPEADA